MVIQAHRLRPGVEPLEERAVPGSVLTGVPAAAVFALDLDRLLLSPFAPAAGTASAAETGPLTHAANLGPQDRPALAAPPPATGPVGGPAPGVPVGPDEMLVAVNALAPKPTVRGPSLYPGATYLFNDNLLPEQKEAPWLIPLDPFGMNSFEPALVYGQEREVYRFDGNGSPSRENAGLLIGTQGLITPNSYSVEFVFASLERGGSYRRVLDTTDRQSDTGLYVSPSNVLNLYPEGSGNREIALDTFYHVVVTNVAGTVLIYVDGVRDLTVTNTTSMNIDNPLGLLYLFVDDTEGVSGEYGDMRVALLRFYDGALSARDVAALAQDPFAYP